MRGWQKHSLVGANDAQGHPKVVCMRNHPTPISAGVDTDKRVNVASNFKPLQHHTRCCHGSGHGWERGKWHTTHLVGLIDVSPCFHQSLEYIETFFVSGPVKRALTTLQSRTGGGGSTSCGCKAMKGQQRRGGWQR